MTISKELLDKLSQNDPSTTSVNFAETDLNDDDLIALANALQNNTHVKALSLCGTKISTLAPLAQLTGLEKLDLSFTSIGNTELDHLTQMTNLRKLNLNHTKIDNLACLSSLKNLRELYLFGLGIQDLSPIVSLINLKIFAVPHSKLDFAPLAKLTNLKFIDVDPKTYSGLTIEQGNFFKACTERNAELAKEENEFKKAAIFNQYAEQLKVAKVFPTLKDKLCFFQSSNSIAGQDHNEKEKKLELSSKLVEDHKQNNTEESKSEMLNKI